MLSYDTKHMHTYVHMLTGENPDCVVIDDSVGKATYIRVTRLREFSPIGRLFTLSILTKIREVA
jgi:hypothetical protein